ncbi:MAG: TIGR04013 family B12-binding domain/radical SAM domain-containing protein [Candidatus Thorarchaeota archaeon]
MGTHSLIFRAHSSSRYSVAVLLGAVEIDHRLNDLGTYAPLKVDYHQIRNLLEKSNVMIAFSVMSTQINRVREEVQALREQFGKRITLVAGGPHASARPNDLLGIGFDYVVIGEGEHVFPEMLSNYLNDKDLTTIEGVVSESSEIYPSPKDLQKIVLDDYPPFAIGLNIVGPIEVTRGCSFACKFCATPFLTGNKVRHRTPESVGHWLKQAVEKRGFKRTWFLSPNAFCYGGKGRKAVPDKLETLLKTSISVEGLDELFFGSFPSEVRPEFVTNELLEMFRQYVANDTLQIGLQSGSNRVLELANRHHTVEEGMDAIHKALKFEFIPHVDMIFGLPGEKEKDLEDSLELCQDLVEMGAKVHGHVFMPLPGSVFENMPAGRLTTRARKILGELSRKKLLTGSWSNQEKLAKQLESDA